MTNQILQPALPKPFLLNGENVLGGTSGVLVANTVYLAAIAVNTPCVITGVRWHMGATTTGTTDVGIYDANGNLLAHTGVITNTTSATQTGTFGSPIQLGVGKYFLALCPSNSTDTYVRSSSMGAGMINGATATNAGTAGVLPNTTGGFAGSGLRPDISGVVQGSGF